MRQHRLKTMHGIDHVFALDYGTDAQVWSLSKKKMHRVDDAPLSTDWQVPWRASLACKCQVTQIGKTDVLACGQGPRVGQAARSSPPRHRIFKHFSSAPLSSGKMVVESLPEETTARYSEDFYASMEPQAMCGMRVCVPLFG